ncbi:MOSC domain-containing protein [Paenibacillus sp. PL2-23]|uniref:MOSC domain-containing protein n=1 Tax=Paenibacillus sp. PL2-23 TaxID=2100729 RepID=UPI0030F585D6
MSRTVGAISGINRYPVKSFGGERLEFCEIETYGMKGDRFGAFYDETKSGWSRFITARNIPSMLTYQAAFVDGGIRVKAADGRSFGWDEELLDEIQSKTSTTITMSRLREPHPENPDLMSVDGDSILLITDASLKKLEAMCGQELDDRRFRGNFIVALQDEALHEGDWIGSQLAIGDVVLQVDGYCERCSLVMIDPETLQMNKRVLQKVKEEMDLNFGVYASVVRTGRIGLGDEVRLV